MIEIAMGRRLYKEEFSCLRTAPLLLVSAHIVTLGWDHPSRIVPSVMRKGLVDRVELVCAEATKEEQKEIAFTIAQWLQRQFEGLGVPAGIRRVPPYDAREIFRAMVAIEAAVEGPLAVNITGGTKIMVVTAVMYAMTSPRRPQVYYGAAEEYASALKTQRLTPDKVGVLPKEDFQSWGFLENFPLPTQEVLLLRPREREGAAVSDDPGAAILLILKSNEYHKTADLVVDASEVTNKSVNTVRERLKTLQREGLVDVAREGREAAPHLTPTGRELAALLEVRTTLNTLRRKRP